MELSGSEKTKWLRLKGEIVKRPFLAYTIGLSQEDVNSLFSENWPSKEKLSYIDQQLQKVKEQKVERLRPFLTKVVGNRGSSQFGEKVGVDGMTIKYIIDDRSKKVPSFDLISRIEIFLSYSVAYEVSLENQNDLINYVSNKVDMLKTDTFKVADDIRGLNHNFDVLKLLDKQQKKSFGNPKSDDWRLSQLRSTISSSINKLVDIQSAIKILIDNFTE